MSASSAEYYEVRWRIQGSDEAWSNPQRVSPVGEIVVTELERDKSYDFQVRSVSNCGAKSLWVDGSHAVPTTPAGTLTLADLQTSAADAQAAADAANAALASISSDGILAAGEKPPVIRDYSVITTEQAGIDAQATAYGITTEKTAYDDKVSALASYLATLTSPVLWSDLSGDTTIVGATFRQKFADVYTARQTLLNAIYAAAKSKADTARAAADAAQKSADVAQSNLYIINPKFVDGLNGWAVDSFPGGWYAETGTVSPSPMVPSYVVHAGSTVAVNTNHIATTALRNNGFGAVKADQVISASALIRPSGGPDGLADVRISWRRADQSEIRVDRGNAVTNATGTGMSRVTGTAPVGAVYAHIEVGAYSHTVGFYTYTACDWTYQPSSLDEVPNSATYLKSLARSQGLVENGDFEVGDSALFPPPGWQLGSVVVDGGVTFPHYDTASQYAGSRSLGFTATQYNGYESVRRYPVTPGDYYAIGGWVVGTGALYALYFLNAANGVTGNISIASGGFQTTTGKVPAGSVSAILVLANFSPGANVVEFDALFMARCSSFDNTLSIPGSGQRLGDLRNQVMTGVGNYGAGWSGGSITYSATSTSATISAAAATLQVDITPIAYSASSVTVSGSAGTSVTYYLYYDDDNYTGGSKTLNATTSQITALSARGRLMVGQVTVTFPTSGTGGGSGGTSCPSVDAWVIRRGSNGEHETVRAGSIVVGDDLALARGGWGRVTYSVPKLMPCVRVIVNNHDPFSLSCSRTAPLGLCSGGSVLAPDSLGEWVRVLHPVPALCAVVTAVEDIGTRWVQHITCEDDFFWAGDHPGCLFSHHNLKPPIP